MPKRFSVRFQFYLEANTMRNKNKRLVACYLAITSTLSVLSLTTKANEVDETCNNDTPVIMVVAGRTLDRAQMGKYAQALAQSGLYPKARGYYLNNPRPIRHLEGNPHADDVALMVRFPSECAALTFWNSDEYQNNVKPLRLNPRAGDYIVTLYAETEVPSYMAGLVADNAYTDQ